VQASLSRGGRGLHEHATLAHVLTTRQIIIQAIQGSLSRSRLSRLSASGPGCWARQPVARRGKHTPWVRAPSVAW
jgi:hypothetical protein